MYLHPTLKLFCKLQNNFVSNVKLEIINYIKYLVSVQIVEAPILNIFYCLSRIISNLSFYFYKFVFLKDEFEYSLCSFEAFSITEKKQDVFYNRKYSKYPVMRTMWFFSVTLHSTCFQVLM